MDLDAWFSVTLIAERPDWRRFLPEVPSHNPECDGTSLPGADWGLAVSDDWPIPFDCLTWVIGEQVSRCGADGLLGPKGAPCHAPCFMVEGAPGWGLSMGGNAGGLSLYQVARLAATCAPYVGYTVPTSIDALSSRQRRDGSVSAYERQLIPAHISHLRSRIETRWHRRCLGHMIFHSGGGNYALFETTCYERSNTEQLRAAVAGDPPYPGPFRCAGGAKNARRCVRAAAT
eukprot:gene29972-66562_t